MNGKFQSPTEDPLLLRLVLSAIAIGFVALFLVLPLLIVFKEALARPGRRSSSPMPCRR